MRSFFFIPANKKKFIEKIDSIEATDLIFDLEDALFNTSIEEALNNLMQITIKENYWIRISLENFENNSSELLKSLINKGFFRFVLPKIEYLTQVDDFVKFSNKFTENNIKIIVLIESPLGLLNSSEIVTHPSIKGFGLGSHDYCKMMGMKHTLSNINWARMSLLNISKAYKLLSIDIASMNINNDEEFINECLDGKDKGFEGKFLIHPFQLKLFKKSWKFSDKEIEFALKVKAYINALGGLENFTIANIDGTVVEKPHINRINTILTTNNYGSI